MILSEGHTVSSVYSFQCDNECYNFNTQIQEICRQHKIPTFFKKPDDTLLNELESQGVELIVSAGYPHKIPVNDSIRGINIHPTLLPRGRGVWPLPWTILLQDKVSGVSIHKLSNTWDAGDVVQQIKFNILENETLESLSCKAGVAAVECLQKVLTNVDDAWNSATPQESEHASYWEMPSSEDRTIHLEQDIDTIDRVIRAFGTADSFVAFDNKHWFVQGATTWKEAHNHKPGTVVSHNSNLALLAAKDGYVCLTHYRINPYVNDQAAQ